MRTNSLHRGRIDLTLALALDSFSDFRQLREAMLVDANEALYCTASSCFHLGCGRPWLSGSQLIKQTARAFLLLIRT